MTLRYIDSIPDGDGSDRPEEHSSDCACLLCSALRGEWDPNTAKDKEDWPCWSCGAPQDVEDLKRPSFGIGWVCPGCEDGL